MNHSQIGKVFESEKLTTYSSIHDPKNHKSAPHHTHTHLLWICICIKSASDTKEGPPPLLPFIPLAILLLVFGVPTMEVHWDIPCSTSVSDALRSAQGGYKAIK